MIPNKMGYINEDLLPEGLVDCPVCKTQYTELSEQDMAIVKRGKCIDCIIKDPNEEKIKMNPYEFRNETN